MIILFNLFYFLIILRHYLIMILYQRIVKKLITKKMKSN